jgi:S1-C subfamily serine protease
VNVLDLVLIGAVVVFAWVGWRQGFVAGLLSFIGFLGGGLTAALLLPGAVESFNVPDPLGALGLAAAILAAAIVGQTLAAALGRRLRDGITWRPAQVLDNAGGAVLNIAALSLVVWIVASAVAVLPDVGLARQVRSSVLLAGIDRVVPDAARNLFVGLRDAVDASGLPRVFSGLGQSAGPEVPPPDRSLLRDPAVRAAWPSLARVTGTACQTSVTGSGFVYADDRILTNAHVVAGIDEPRVRIPGDPESYRATVVAWDPDLDLAVLWVPGLVAPPLRFSERVADTGDSAVVAGFPGGGDLEATPARIRAMITARGEDIYGRTGVVRELYTFRGDVRPGNSGGPLLAPDGSVYGVVFASGVGDPETGYAVTAAQAARLADAGRSATAPVDPGSCRTR